MAIAPADNQEYAKAIRAVYQEAERMILDKIAKRVAKGGSVEDPNHWLDQKLNEIRRHEAEMNKIIMDLNFKGPETIKQLVVQAYLSGAVSADSDLVGYAVGLNEKPITVTPEGAKDPVAVVGKFGATHTAAVNALIAEVMGGLQGAHVEMARKTKDAYRNIINEVAPAAVAGIETRQQATQRALKKFADQEIGQFKGKDGRKWDIATYAEMSTRTGMAQAHIQGHINRMVEQGRDLVIVSSHPEESDLCRPHQGKVYSISGDHPRYKSLKWAISDGLFHPNCRHTINAYIEGLTETPDVPGDPEGYKIRQKHRYMERQIRHWKKREIVAITPKDKKYAAAKVAHWEDQLKDFLHTHDRKRKRAREKVHTGLVGKPPAPDPKGMPDGLTPAAKILTPDKITKKAEKEVKEASDDLTKATASNPYQAATSIDELNDLLKGKTAFDNFDDIDLDMMKDFAQSTDRAIEKFPELGDYLGRIGGMSPEEWAGAGADERGVMFTNKTTGMFGKNVMVNLNQLKGSKDELERLWQEDVESGFIHKGASASSALTHEYGHVTVNMLNKMKLVDGDIAEHIEREIIAELGLSKEDVAKGLSRYATESPDEFIAEAFAEFVDSPNPRPIAKAVGEKIQKLLGGGGTKPKPTLKPDAPKPSAGPKSLWEFDAPAPGTLPNPEDMPRWQLGEMSKMVPDSRMLQSMVEGGVDPNLKKLYRDMVTEAKKEGIPDGDIHEAIYRVLRGEKKIDDFKVEVEEVGLDDLLTEMGHGIADYRSSLLDEVPVPELSVQDKMRAIATDQFDGEDLMEALKESGDRALQKEFKKMQKELKDLGVPEEGILDELYAIATGSRTMDDVAATMKRLKDAEPKKMSAPPSEDLMSMVEESEDAEDMMQWLDGDKIGDEFKRIVAELGVSDQEAFETIKGIAAEAKLTPDELRKLKDAEAYKQSLPQWEKDNYEFQIPDEKDRAMRRNDAKKKSQFIIARKYPQYMSSDRLDSIDWDRYFADTKKHLQRLLKKSLPTVRVSPHVLNLVSKDRFRTQFETNTSQGTLNQGLRARVENKLMGVPLDVDPKMRPIYGLMDNERGQTDQGIFYGSIKVRLKKSVYERSTMTIGDSLAWEHEAAGMRMTDPDTSFVQYDLLGTDSIEKIHDSSYTEFQVHGGLGLDDIERVDIMQDDLEDPEIYKTLDHLESLGIEVRVWDDIDADRMRKPRPTRSTTWREFKDNDYEI